MNCVASGFINALFSATRSPLGPGGGLLGLLTNLRRFARTSLVLLQAMLADKRGLSTVSNDRRI